MPDSDDKSNPPTQGTKNISIPPSGKAVLPYQDQPPKGAPDRQIHPRRPLPPVPDATPQPTEDKPDSSDSQNAPSRSSA